MRASKRVSSGLVATAILAGSSLVATAGANAQEEPPDAGSVVRIDSFEAPFVFVDYCVDPPEVTRRTGEVVISRTGSDVELSVPIIITGPVDNPADQMVFAVGESTVVLPLAPAIDHGYIEVTIPHGEGYALGEPSSQRFLIDHPVADCPLPSSTTTTMPPGTTPATTPRGTTLPQTGSSLGWLFIAGSSLVAAGSVFLIQAHRSRHDPRSRVARP